MECFMPQCVGWRIGEQLGEAYPWALPFVLLVAAGLLVFLFWPRSV